MRKLIARWCVGWVGLVESLIEILTFGMIMARLRLRCAELFARKGWF